MKIFGHLSFFDPQTVGLAKLVNELPALWQNDFNENVVKKFAVSKLHTASY